MTERAMVRAWARNDISSDELASAVRRFDELDVGTKVDFEDLVQAGGPKSLKGASELDDAAFRSLIGADLGAGTEARTLRLVADGEVDSAHIRQLSDLMDAGEIDQTDVGRMLEMLETKEIDSLIDSDLTATKILEIGEEGDVSETLLALDDSGSARWLETGTSGEGWRHIVYRHDDDFFKLEGIDSKKDMKDHIYQTVKNGESHPDPNGGLGYVRETYPGQEMTVIVGDNGFIVTSFPGRPNWLS